MSATDEPCAPDGRGGQEDDLPGAAARHTAGGVGAGAAAGGARGGPAADASGGAAGPPEPPQQQQQPCAVCGEQPPKYRCPGCDVRSCSAACVARHKADSGCTGKRDRLAFVPLGDFGDRELLSGGRGGARSILRPAAQSRACTGEAGAVSPRDASRTRTRNPAAQADPLPPNRRAPTEKKTTAGWRRYSAPTTTPSATARPRQSRSCRRRCRRSCTRRGCAACGC
jgi:hypothetical protein